METIYYNELEMYAQFVTEHDGKKVFLCQDRIAITNENNIVLGSIDLLDYMANL